MTTWAQRTTQTGNYKIIEVSHPSYAPYFSEGRTIANIIGKMPIDYANAQMIAAAPEMYSELKRELDWLKHIKPQITAPPSIMSGFDQAIKYIEETLSKARGE